MPEKAERERHRADGKRKGKQCSDEELTAQKDGESKLFHFIGTRVHNWMMNVIT